MIFPDLAANISYTLKLDAKRYNHRAYFLPKNRVLSEAVNVTLEEVCKDHPFFIEVSHISLLLLQIFLYQFPAMCYPIFSETLHLPELHLSRSASGIMYAY